MILRRTCLAALLLVLVACRPDTLDMGYRFQAGTELHYRMTAEASARWDIGGPGEGSYEVTFDVTERVEESTADGAVVSVSITPTDVNEQGLSSPGTENRTFTLEVGHRGEVRDVIEVDGVPATALDPEELAFIGTYRPPLPLEPVALRATWEAEQELTLGEVFQQVTTVGELQSVGKEGGATTAELSYEGGGPLVWTAPLPQGEAALSGDSRTFSEALLDVDHGYLLGARSTTEGAFDVEVEAEPGGLPLTGSLELELSLELEKLD